MIPHKVLNIRCYICTYLALFFIFVFIRLLEYQILQFHAFLLSSFRFGLMPLSCVGQWCLFITLLIKFIRK